MLAQAATPSSSRYAPLSFFLAGLAPFGVGTLLAGVSGFPIRWEVLGAGVVAIGALIRSPLASLPERRLPPARDGVLPGENWPLHGCC